MSKTKTPKSVQRGQVWFITSDPDAPAIGAEIWPHRYGVVISANPIASKSNAVTVAYITTSPAKVKGAPMSPTHVVCRLSGKDAVILCEQPTTVDKSRLERYSHTLRESTMKKVDKAISFALSISSVDCSAAYAKWERRISNGTAVLANSSDEDESDVTMLARENARLRAERDSYKTLLRVRDEAESDVKNHR